MQARILVVAAIAAAACARNSGGVAPANPSTRAGPFEFSGTAVVEQPHRLHVSVGVQNATSRPVSISFGECSMTVLVYTTSPSKRKLVWDLDLWSSQPPSAPGPRLGRICLSYAMETTALPGERGYPREMDARLDIPSILGDSLPGGTYAIVAQVGVSTGQDQRPISTRLELGTVVLER